MIKLTIRSGVGRAMFAACAVVAFSAAAVANGLPKCAMDGSTLGVSRIVEIDTSTGALFGSISTQVR